MAGGPLQQSAIDRLIQETLKAADQSPDYHALALQVFHNLRHQHEWSDLAIHTTVPSTAATPSDASIAPRPLPRPLVSGLPPRRVYLHPDEQIQVIKAGIKDEDLPSVREWVLPSHLQESWSLHRFGEVFDAISNVPPLADGQLAPAPDVWRQTKRLMLATIDDDSTVVYYIVHDGIVKPRQN